MRVHELTRKAENLIEQGKIAKQRQIYYQQQVNLARAKVISAYTILEAAASETDEERNSIGDVSSARAEVYAAQAILDSVESELAEIGRQIKEIEMQKMDAVSEIERYEVVEENNMSKLSELQKKRFGSNVNTFMADLAERMNSGEQARLQLLTSMGIATTAKTFSGGMRAKKAASGGEKLGSLPVGDNDSGTFFGGLFRKNDYSFNRIVSNFNGFSLEIDEMSGDKYFVKGNNYEKFIYFWKNSDQFYHTEVRYIKTINARDIEGIYLNDNEAQNSHLFWNRGHQYDVDSETYFMEAASYIPEVRARLETGEKIDTIRNDERLKKCYDLYFDTPVKVYEIEGYYYFAGSGRHRCMAAQKSGYDIPVEVIRRYEKKGLQDGHISMSSYKPITSDHTIDDDLRKTNPNYSRIDSDSPWNINCQRCVSAYEARRRGYDVEALPAPQGVDYLQVMRHPDGWPSVYKGAKLIDCSANSGTAAEQNVEELVKSWGDNCRGIVRIRWKPENGGGGHVFCVERTNGITRFIDPQNNGVDVKTYFFFAKGSEVYCIRTDNLEFSEKIKQCCKNREERKGNDQSGKSL